MPFLPRGWQDSDDEDKQGWQALLLDREPTSSDWESVQMSQEAQQEMQQQLMELASPMKQQQGGMTEAGTPTKRQAV